MNTSVGKLIVCPTPLGNLGDMPPRALEALRAADVVCCEDTRVTGKLLAALGVQGKRLERMDEATIRMPANRTSPGTSLSGSDCETVGEMLISRVLGGENIVYCSDAGMPGVSDPGQLLVSLARQFGATVQVLPGPTAVVSAYVASGFTCPRFYFGGFFPRKAGERKTAVELIKQLDAVCVFYESPHRVVACLQAIADELPARSVAVCRELTKLHEEVVVGSALDLAEQFAERETASGGIKGEIVVVVDVAASSETAQDDHVAMQQAANLARQLLAEGNLSKKDIVARLREECGLTRNAAYDIVVDLQR